MPRCLVLRMVPCCLPQPNTRAENNFITQDFERAADPWHLICRIGTQHNAVRGYQSQRSMTLVALLLPSEAHRDARALALCVRGFRARGLSWAGVFVGDL